MKLTQAQRDKLIAKLEGFPKRNPCDMCGNRHWLVDDTIFEVREFHGANIKFNSAAIKPVVSLTCSVCGNTKLLNAIQLGLIEPDTTSVLRQKGGSNERL